MYSKYNMKYQSLQNLYGNVLKILNVLCSYELYVTTPELYVLYNMLHNMLHNT